MTEVIDPIQASIDAFCQEVGVNPARLGTRNYPGVDGKTAGVALNIGLNHQGQRVEVFIQKDGSFNPSREEHVQAALPYAEKLRALDEENAERIDAALAAYEPGTVAPLSLPSRGVVFRPQA